MNETPEAYSVANLPSAQFVTITVYPNRTPEQQQVEGYVYGDWLVHRPNLTQAFVIQGFMWGVTHIPSSALACISRELAPALKAAKVLAEIEQPTVTRIEDNEDETGYNIEPLSIAWAQQMVDAMMGIDVYMVGKYGPISITDVVEHVIRKHIERRMRQMALAPEA